jgi:energy-coupling factor transporter ATP-binding protein EcfA2
LLRQIAVKKAGQPIEANDVIEEFQKTSGLTTPFADDRGSFERDDLVASLHRRVIGQDLAVAAVADAVSVARSNLADPARPFASLLFLGPTGAGKTELAKALARVLFGSEEKLIRFDLNEFSTSDAAARLSGSLDQPEGLLSSAIRREPWCVLLLDEIEKAHPRVFDVLLQVLDDARLTDALGQTASFQNVFIVMTSNLGARDAASGVGFDSSSRERTAVFLEAAEKFFRPEFMGRLDRVVTFHPLSRENLSKVARLLLNEILSREGFRRNHAVLDLHPRGLERLVDEGRHPQLGARALKRALERHLVHPVAVHLSGRSREGVSVVRMDAPDGKFETSVVDLVEAGPVPSPFAGLDTSDPLAFLGRVDAFLDRLRMSVRNLSTQQDLATRRIEAGAWALEGCSALSDRVSLLREELDTNSLIVSAAAVSSLLRSAPRPSSDDYGNMKASLLRQLCAVRDAAAHLQDVAAATRRPRSKISSLLEEMAVDALRLETQVEEVLTSEVPPRALLLTRTIGSQILHFWDLLGVSPAQLKSLDGPSGWTYTLCEGSWNVQEALWRTGTSLVWLPDGSIVPVEVRLLPLSPGDNEELAAKRFAETCGIDPAGTLGAVNLVVSFKEGRGTAVDVRTREAFPIEVMSEDTEYTLMPAYDGLLEYKKLSAAHAALPREFLEEPA